MSAGDRPSERVGRARRQCVAINETLWKLLWCGKISVHSVAFDMDTLGIPVHGFMQWTGSNTKQEARNGGFLLANQGSLGFPTTLPHCNDGENGDADLEPIAMWLKPESLNLHYDNPQHRLYSRTSDSMQRMASARIDSQSSRYPIAHMLCGHEGLISTPWTVPCRSFNAPVHPPEPSPSPSPAPTHQTSQSSQTPQ